MATSFMCLFKCETCKFCTKSCENHFMFSGFLDIESEISVQKDFDHVLAMGS